MATRSEEAEWINESADRDPEGWPGRVAETHGTTVVVDWFQAIEAQGHLSGIDLRLRPYASNPHLRDAVWAARAAAAELTEALRWHLRE